jgi:hypothetical protein
VSLRLGYERRGTVDSVASLLGWIAWLVGVPLLVFGVLKVFGYDFDKPWLKGRGPYRPLPAWVYLVFAGCLGLLLLFIVVAR